VNQVSAENARPGTPDWALQHPATLREIEGYAGATSVNRGESIELFVHTHAPRFTVEVFRMGWYQGLGARRVAGPIEQPGTAQVIPTMDAQTGLVDCAWVNPFVLQTGDDWVSGVHLVRLTAQSTARRLAHDSGAQSFIFFVLRDDEGHSALEVQLPVTTYQAYNTWGGKSLYHWGSTDGQRASKVSFNRPYAANAQNPAAAFGMGAGEFLTNLQPHPQRYKVSNAGWDVNTVRWLEREGCDVAYSTNLDMHARHLPTRRHKAWLSIGHDEYWTREMRDHVEAARDAGVHLGFFGANSAYWQVRLEHDDRIMVCHKKAKHDPGADVTRLTDKWRSKAVNRPEEQLIGVMYAGDPVDADIVVTAPHHWVFEGSGLAAQDRLPGLLGYEVDCAQGHGPHGLEILAASPWTALTDAGKHGVAHMSLYTAASGAVVFATGSMQWAWGLDDFNAPTLRSSRLSAAAQQVTRNLLGRFAST
jgi:hypothetical protein